jgi:hypothetical protein
MTIRIELEPDEAHPHERHYTSSKFLVFWRDQFGTIRFAAHPPEDDEWIELMDGISEGEIGVFEEDEPDPHDKISGDGEDQPGDGG